MALNDMQVEQLYMAVATNRTDLLGKEIEGQEAPLLDGTGETHGYECVDGVSCHAEAVTIARCGLASFFCWYSSLPWQL